MKSDKNSSMNHIPFHILLADDDEDDQYFFESAVTKLHFDEYFKFVENGEELMIYLHQHEGELPDVLFLDYNMPRKNGEECLKEIKQHPKLKDLPVVMYSTYLNEDVADAMYDIGAHFYVRKTNEQALEKMLEEVYVLLMVQKTDRPEKEKFTITF